MKYPWENEEAKKAAEERSKEFKKEQDQAVDDQILLDTIFRSKINYMQLDKRSRNILFSALNQLGIQY